MTNAVLGSFLFQGVEEGVERDGWRNGIQKAVWSDLYDKSLICDSIRTGWFANVKL